MLAVLSILLFVLIVIIPGMVTQNNLTHKYLAEVQNEFGSDNSSSSLQQDLISIDLDCAEQQGVCVSAMIFFVLFLPLVILLSFLTLQSKKRLKKVASTPVHM